MASKSELPADDDTAEGHAVRVRPKADEDMRAGRIEGDGTDTEGHGRRSPKADDDTTEGHGRRMP